MRSTEAEKVKKKKSLNCLILYFHVSLAQLQPKLLYIYIFTLYAISCLSYTSTKISVHTARLKRIKRCVCFTNSDVGPALVQTWFVRFTHLSLHAQWLTCRSMSSMKQNSTHFFFFFLFSLKLNPLVAFGNKQQLSWCCPEEVLVPKSGPTLPTASAEENDSRPEALLTRQLWSGHWGPWTQTAP